MSDIAHDIDWLISQLAGAMKEIARLRRVANAAAETIAHYELVERNRGVGRSKKKGAAPRPPEAGDSAS